jgi:GT2 family glycosyltransferase
VDTTDVNQTDQSEADGLDDITDLPRVHVIVVHYNSGGMLLELLRGLAGQTEVDIDLHVVECGDDGTVCGALEEYSFQVEIPGENLGYSGGNNRVLRRIMYTDDPVCIVNPDVELRDPLTLSEMWKVLKGNPEIAAVAPSIRTAEGRIEYTESKIDLARACAIHTGTHVDQWGPAAPRLVVMPWIDGACWMLRSEALRKVGVLDETYFLLFEEVDWCIRASQRDWRVAVLRDVEVEHQRSSSFGNSSKGSYYAWRNTFLLCKKHEGYGKWIGFWAWRLCRFALERRHLRSGEAAAAVRGARDAICGRTGRMPKDD